LNLKPERIMSADKDQWNNNRRKNHDPIEKQILRTSTTLINQSKNLNINSVKPISSNIMSNGNGIQPNNHLQQQYRTQNIDGKDIMNANIKVSSINQSLNEITRNLKRTNLN